MKLLSWPQGLSINIARTAWAWTERVSDLNKGRLTDLGMRLCETIRTYNLETSEDGN